MIYRRQSGNEPASLADRDQEQQAHSHRSSLVTTRCSRQSMQELSSLGRSAVLLADFIDFASGLLARSGSQRVSLGKE